MTDFLLVENDVFAELYGIVLVNVSLLERLWRSRITGANLLDQFSQTMEGERVCMAGAVVPVLGITGEYYTVTIRSRASMPSVVNPKKSSPGWIFRAEAEASILCGLGYLVNWNPKAAPLRHIAIPPGWYTVEFGMGFVQDNPNSWGLDFILDVEAEKPEFTANPQNPFDLYLEDETSR